MRLKSILLYSIVLLLALISIVSYPWIKRFFQIDSCLDIGGSWNYKTGQCDGTIPDNIIINEILIEAIKQDSLDTTLPIISKLVNYYFYNLDIVKDSNLEYPIPPPPPPSNEKGEPLILQYFRYSQEKNIGYTISICDSTFFERQMNNAKNIELDSSRFNDIIPFENDSQNKLRRREYYEFLIPLFNCDKSIAWVQYNYHCPACGYGRMVILKEINNTWLKIDSYTTWRN